MGENKREYDIIKFIIMSNVIIFLFEYATSSVRDNVYFLSIGGYESTKSFLRAFSCQFIHLNWFHLITNMIALYYLNTKCKEIYSEKKILLGYVIGIISVAIFLVAFGVGGRVYIGNSGAILSVFGLYLHSELRKKESKGEILRVIGIVVFMSILPGVSFIMHFAGVITGIILGFLYIKYKKVDS